MKKMWWVCALMAPGVWACGSDGGEVADTGWSVDCDEDGGTCDDAEEQGEDAGAEVGEDAGEDAGETPCGQAAITTTPDEVFAGDLVDLDASGSTPPEGGAIAEHVWTLISTPMGAGAQFEVAAADDSKARLLTGAPGLYVVDLQVIDDAGNLGCTPARVEIEAKRREGTRSVRVEMSWTTAGDADPNDDVGADLDLHYLLPMGLWNTSGDVYWDNVTAEVGASGAADDPRLTQESASSLMPEIVYHEDPPNGLYVVGVYYADDAGLGGSEASVRIEVDGAVALEVRDTFLIEAGTFWEAATITWPGGSVLPIGNVQAGFPD